MNHSPLFYSIEGVLIQKLLLMAERKGSAVSYNELKINNLEDTEGEVTFLNGLIHIIFSVHSVVNF